MLALVIALAAVTLLVTTATVRAVRRDGYGPVPTRPDYDSRQPSLR